MKRQILRSLLFVCLLGATFPCAVLAQGFVYTNNDIFGGNKNTVTGFTVAQNGALTTMPGAPFKTGDGGGDPLTGPFGGKVVVSARGAFLFAANDGGGTISVFRIGVFDGELTPVEGSPFNSNDAGDDRGMALALNPDERYLYAANYTDQTISVFYIEDSGALTLVPGSPYGVDGKPKRLEVSVDGKFLAVILGGDSEDKVGVYSIGPGGMLTPAPGSPFANESSDFAIDIAIDCQSKFLFLTVAETIHGPVTVEVFTMDQNGSLTPVAASPFSFDFGQFYSAGSLTLSPDGKLLFVGGLNGGLSVYRVSSDGSLTLAPGSPYSAFGIGQVETNREGNLLFVGTLSQSVEVATIKPDGSLALVDGSPFATGEEDGPQLGEGFGYSLAAFPPVSKCRIIPPDDIEVAADADQCDKVVKYSAPQLCGYQCEQVEISCSPESGATFPVGVTSVTCLSNVGVTATFTVTVKDQQFPDIDAPESFALPTEPGKCTAVATFDFSASDNCPGVIVTAEPPSGSVFPKGATQVTITATDKAGNVTQAVFAVVVKDEETPSINCPADVSVNNEPNQCGAAVNYQLPAAADNCPGVGAVSCNPPSGTFFPVGATVVTCKATDAAQNEGQCVFTVTVKDIQPPQINCPADVTAATAGVCVSSVVVNYPSPQVADNCPNNLSVVCVPASGSVFPVGTTNVTCTVTDGGGNQSQCSFKVTVFDVWLQDDSNPANVLLFNSQTGEYRLCYAGVNQPVTGVGVVIKKGCTVSLQHQTATQRLVAQADGGMKKGTASYQSPPGILKCTITDKNTANNSTICQ